MSNFIVALFKSCDLTPDVLKVCIVVLCPNIILLLYHKKTRNTILGLRDVLEVHDSLSELISKASECHLTIALLSVELIDTLFLFKLLYLVMLTLINKQD